MGTRRKTNSGITRLKQPNPAQTDKNWTMPEEKQAVIKYVKENYPQNSVFLKTVYPCLAYEMRDNGTAALSPSVVYRLLKAEGLLNSWDTKKKSAKGNGFKQPDAPHQQWHTDIKYVNFLGTFLFLITVMDGYSRYVLHHELRFNMTEYDVRLTVQKAREKYPMNNPRLISDNGPQYKAKDFGVFLKDVGLQHIKISVGYPQSNGKMERFFRTLGEECLRLKSMHNIEEARSTVSIYVEYYNKKRAHSSLFYLTPDDFLSGNAEQKLKEREQKIQTAAITRQQHWSNSVSV